MRKCDIHDFEELEILQGLTIEIDGDYHCQSYMSW